MKPYSIPYWKPAPFLRLLPPLIIGIILQWYLPISFSVIIIALFVFLFLVLMLSFSSLTFKFKYGVIYGIVLNLFLAWLGIFITYQKNSTHQANWFAYQYRHNDFVVVALTEPPVEKQNSFKADAQALHIIHNDSVKRVSGKIILYFQKDTLIPKYGNIIVFQKSLQRIKSSGNPGAFNYEQYAAMQQIYHQAYLKQGDFVISSQQQKNIFTGWLYKLRTHVIEVLKKNIQGKSEQSIAEALMIGYRNDLDRDLVQAYSNTGVVHIIAISGMHLGLIYAALIFLLKPLNRYKKMRWLKPVLLLSILWMYSLLAGGGGSVIRSAVMFTFIIVGETISKKASLYNILAASAFIMLCYNPFYLWDVGFQLSYAAVFSILIFQKSIYNWFTVNNKLLDAIWRLLAVSTAAQILTLPISMYHFHQLPVLFLLSNLIAVPLSTIILFGTLMLYAISFIQPAAWLIGKIVTSFLWLMNSFIERINNLPFSVIDELQFSIPQIVLLFAMILFFSYWLYEKNKTALKAALLFSLAFISIRAIKEFQYRKQAKLIVYNVPDKQAIDFISGKNYVFKGNQELTQDGFLQNFHLKPSRIFYQTTPTTAITALQETPPFYFFYNKHISIIDSAYRWQAPQNKIPVDLLILSNNPSITIAELHQTFSIPQIVIDASNTIWKTRQWKTECDMYQLPCYIVANQGAFVWDIKQ